MVQTSWPAKWIAEGCFRDENLDLLAAMGVP
jgi:hypothetical protein